ncbi:MAG: M1 family metallopeptidase [Dactylosporangium sp.]|nr:M1 family metallopeptidase [Dactylosporangium sp.]NNJ63564.1 M1 family metallopeptidase [Dactylosporangium sp.]
MARRAYGYRVPIILTAAVLAVAMVAMVGVITIAVVRSRTADRPQTTALPWPLPTQHPMGPLPPTDGSSQPVADPVYPGLGNPSIDVQHYKLALSWTPAQHRLVGTATLKIRIVRPVDGIGLDFAAALAVHTTTLDGRPVDAVRTGDDLFLPAEGPLGASSVVTALITYSGTPREASFPGTRKDVVGLGAMIAENDSIAAVQEPYGAFTWFPCNDQPSDKALFDVTITAPAGWSGVSSGLLTATTVLDDGSTTFHWHGAQPSATYLLAFAVDRFERFDDTGPHGLPLTYWIRKEQTDQMLPVLRRTPVIIEWLEHRFGPYPFDSGGVVIVPNDVTSAMETQTMISMGAIPGDLGGVVLAHELAHQWFGDSITPSTWRDLWLNEGFATYADMLYSVDFLERPQSDLIDSWHDADRDARVLAGPPGNYDPTRFASGNVYVGPALMLHALRLRVGDPQFFAILHDWVQHHRYGTTNRAEFTRWLNAYVGQDLTPILDLWLDATTTPDLPR